MTSMMLPADSSAASQDRQREGEREPDEQTLDDQPRERDHVRRDVLPLQRHRGEADRDRHGDDPPHPGRDHRRGEQRRDQEQRRHPGEHEDEARELVPGKAAEELAHEPTIVGIEVNRALV